MVEGAVATNGAMIDTMRGYSTVRQSFGCPDADVCPATAVRGAAGVRVGVEGRLP